LFESHLSIWVVVWFITQHEEQEKEVAPATHRLPETTGERMFIMVSVNNAMFHPAFRQKIHPPTRM
jgi:hypothetical protein